MIARCSLASILALACSTRDAPEPVPGPSARRAAAPRAPDQIELAALPQSFSSSRADVHPSAPLLLVRTNDYVAALDRPSQRVRAVVARRGTGANDEGEQHPMHGERFVLVPSREGNFVWDLETAVLRAVGPATRDVALGADGARLVAVHGERLQVWGVSTRELEREIELPGQVTRLAVDARSERALVETSHRDASETRLVLLELASGRELGRHVIPWGSGIQSAFEPRTLAVAQHSASQDRLWARSADQLTERWSIPLDPGPFVRRFGWSADGRTLWTSSESSLDLFDVERGERVSSVSTSSVPITHLGLHVHVGADRTALVFPHAGGVWRAPAGGEAARIGDVEHAGSARVFSRDGSIFTTISGSSIEVRDARDARVRERYTPGGRMVVPTGAEIGEGEIAIHDEGWTITLGPRGATVRPRRPLRRAPTAVRHLAARGEVAIAGCGDEGLCVYRVSDDARLRALAETSSERFFDDTYDDGPSHLVVLTPDGRRAVVSSDRRLRTFDVASGALLASRSERRDVRRLVSISDELVLARLGDAGAHSIVRVGDLGVVRTVVSRGPVHVGRDHLVLENDGALRIVHLHTGALVSEHRDLRVRALSADGSRLLGTEAGRAVVVDLASGAVIDRRDVPVPDVYEADGAFEHTACERGRVRRTRLVAGEEPADLGPCPERARALRASARGLAITGVGWVRIVRPPASLTIRARFGSECYPHSPDRCDVQVLVTDDTTGRFWVAPEHLPLLVARGAGPIPSAPLSSVDASHPGYAPGLLEELLAPEPAPARAGVGIAGRSAE